MKKKGFIISLGMILVTLTMGSTIHATEKGFNQTDQDIVSVKGKVVDEDSNDPLVFATISVASNNVATVTNIDGEFLLKIYEPTSSTKLVFNYLGFENKIVPLSELSTTEENLIKMKPKAVSIEEITVRPEDPEAIVREMLRLRSKNYPSEPNLMTAFFRETIKKRRNYVAISEAALKVFKAPYNNDFRMDMVKIYKGRKSQDVDKMDTVLFKLQGGPHTSLFLDVIKNPNMNFGGEYLDLYNYSLVNISIINNQPHYVIEFSQKDEVDQPLFMGTYYIEVENLGLTESRFHLNVENVFAARNMFIRKKPLNVSVTPETASYVVKYREQDGKWHFAYSRAEVKFIVDYDKKLFNTNYTIMSEIAITDRTTEQATRFDRKERLRRSVIFSEKVSAFMDRDFWGDYNVIEPDASIEDAIKKLSRKLEWQNIKEGE